MFAKAISAKVHGPLDYLAAIAFFAFPATFGLSSVVSQCCYCVAVFQLSMSLLTKYPAGLLRLVPYPVHGVLEFLEGAILVMMPWIMGFAGLEVARNIFVISGVGLLLIWSLSDYTNFWQSPHIISGTVSESKEEELASQR